MDFTDFALSAERLRRRYYRRYPKVDPYKWDATSIKDRWYRRNNCHVIRERLGKVTNEQGRHI